MITCLKTGQTRKTSSTTQEDLFYDEDGDRTLWQLQHDRLQAAKAWQTWVRTTGRGRLQDLPRSEMRLPAAPVPNLSRDRQQTDQVPEETVKEGDNRQRQLD